MSTRGVLLCTGALTLLASAASSSALACSCVVGPEKSGEVRQWVEGMLAESENVALLRAVSVEEVGQFHERAVLRVVRSWKGKSRGSLVHSDTSNIGAGMCDMSIQAGQQILVAFDAEPIVINGCPSDFELTNMEEKYLDRLASRYRTTHKPQTRDYTWGDSLIDAQARMNAYQLRLETLRDAIDLELISAAQCSPEKDASAHRTVTNLLESLVADAPNRGFKADVVESLRQIQSEWQLLRHRQETRWSQSPDDAAVDPRERCLRASDVAARRLAIDREMGSLLKTLIRFQEEVAKP